MASRFVHGLMAASLLFAALEGRAAPLRLRVHSVPLSGQVLGEVQNSAGIAQMGASVTLYNRYDQLVRQALSDETGKFGFDQLMPGVYSIRVALASFLPAVRG